MLRHTPDWRLCGRVLFAIIFVIAGLDPAIQSFLSHFLFLKT
jgi:hypothetical protein